VFFLFFFEVRSMNLLGKLAQVCTSSDKKVVVLLMG